MNPKTKRVVASVIAGVLVLLLILPFVFSGIASLQGEAANTVSGLNEKLSELDKEKEKLKEELAEIQSEKKSAAEQKEAIDAQINLTAQEIATIDSLITQLSEDAAAYQVELAAAEKEEQETYQLFKQRVRAMEENGTSSYISVILSADSFSSLLSRAEIIGDVMNYDRQIMNDLKEQQEEISEKKAAIENSKKEQENAKAKLAQKKEELDAQTDEAAELLDQLSSKEEEYKKAYDEAESAQNEAKAEIKRILAEQAKKNSSSSSSSGGSKYVGGEFTWPVPGRYTITSPYGNRFDPIFKTYKKHTGVDIAASTGTPIVAANSGTVIVAGWSSRGYGNYVVIDHGGGRSTLYAHQSRLAVSKGDTVSKGQTIGYVGSTGYSTGPHLHFEVLINGDDTNPMDYFQKG